MRRPARRFFLIGLLTAIASMALWRHRWESHPAPSKAYSSRSRNTSPEISFDDASLQDAPFALIIPFAGWQSDLVIRNIEDIWSRWPPCFLPRMHSTDLYIYYHKDITKSDHLIPILKSAFEKNDNVSSCFRSLQFLNAGLSDANDVYPLAAARMFFKLFKSSKLSLYRAMYYMEPDNIPCKQGWLDQLVKESRVPGGLWMRGSIIRDRDPVTGQYPYSHHINGNALYAIGDATFRSFVSHTVEPAFWEDPDEFLGGYDVALYMIRQNRTLMSWIHFTETIHLFQYTLLIQNLYRTPGNASLICKEFPNTYLVHGREMLRMAIRQNAFSTASKSYENIDALLQTVKAAYPIILGPDLPKIPDRLTHLGFGTDNMIYNLDPLQSAAPALLESLFTKLNSWNGRALKDLEPIMSRQLIYFMGPVHAWLADKGLHLRFDLEDADKASVDAITLFFVQRGHITSELSLDNKPAPGKTLTWLDLEGVFQSDFSKVRDAQVILSLHLEIPSFFGIRLVDDQGATVHEIVSKKEERALQMTLESEPFDMEPVQRKFLTTGVAGYEGKWKISDLDHYLYRQKFK